MKLTQEVRKQVVAEVERCINAANEYYKNHGRPGLLFGMPHILFNKQGTTAGTANGSRWEVNFNAILLMENQEYFIASTVPHEVAHLIDYRANPDNHHPEPVWTSRGWRRGKRDVHGADFRFIMERVLGADDSTRCHNYDVTNARVRTKGEFEYRCTCGCGTTTTLGPKRHKNEQARPGTYWLRGHGRAKLEWLDAPQQEPIAIAASKPKEKTASSHVRPTSKSSGGSIKDQAGRIFAMTSTRGEFIEACVRNLGMKKSTASTYHHNFKSNKWSV